MRLPIALSCECSCAPGSLGAGHRVIVMSIAVLLAIVVVRRKVVCQGVCTGADVLRAELRATNER